MSSESKSLTSSGASELAGDLADRVASLGAIFDPHILNATRAIFTPFMDEGLPAGGKLIEAVKYGPDDRQCLDLYVPGSRGPTPILLFVPGGGFVRGDRRSYRALGAFFARHGFLVAILDYRLAPENVWPAGAVDVAAALDWSIDHAVEYGGDPHAVIVFGQSAGATHAANCLFDTELRPRMFGSVKGAVLMNGVHRIAPDDKRLNVIQYFGAETGLYEHRSPITHVNASSLPVMLLVAEFDPSDLATGTLDLARAITIRDGHCPPFVWLKGHNHVSPIFAFGSPHDSAGPPILDFVRAVLPSPPGFGPD